MTSTVRIRVVVPVSSTTRGRRSLRWALACYPAQWRQRYGDEVEATFVDVMTQDPSAARHGIELFLLAASGLVVRAKSSVIFWTGLVVVVAIVWASATDYSGRALFTVDAYWPAIQVRPGRGLLFALPVGAIVAAICADRRIRDGLKAGPRLLGAAVDITAITSFIGAGYLIAEAIIVFRSGVPAAGLPNVALPLSFLAMTVGTIAVGYALGSVLPALLAGPIALLAGGFWIWTAGWDGANIGWRNITGFNLAYGAFDVYLIPDPRTMLAVAGFNLLLIVGVLTVIIWPTVVERAIALVLVVLLGAQATVTFSGAALAAVGSDMSSVRPGADLICEGAAPEVCLMPEQDAENGRYVRELVRDAVGRWEQAGFSTPARIETTAITIGEDFNVQRPGVWRFTWSSPLTRSSIFLGLASAATWRPVCIGTPDATDQLRYEAATYGAQLLMGAGADAVPPSYADVGPDGTIRRSDDEVREMIGVQNLTDGNAAIARQLAEPSTC